MKKYEKEQCLECIEYIRECLDAAELEYEKIELIPINDARFNEVKERMKNLFLEFDNIKFDLGIIEQNVKYE